MCLNPETSFGATGFEAISPRHLPTAKNNPIYLFIGVVQVSNLTGPLGKTDTHSYTMNEYRKWQGIVISKT